MTFQTSEIFLIARWNSPRDRIVNKWIFLKIINRYYKPIQTEHFLCKLPLTFKAIEKKKTVSDLIYLTCLQIAALCYIGDCIFYQKISLTISNRDVFLNYHTRWVIFQKRVMFIFFFHLASCSGIENFILLICLKEKQSPALSVSVA